MVTLNYKHLRYFWMVAKAGSIARASEQLHLSPQSISGQLTTLEEVLGVTLFQRAGRQLELTETGRRTLTYADEIFTLGDELLDMLRDPPAQHVLVFKVGVDDVSAGFFFPLPNTEIFRELEMQGKVELSDDFLKLPIYVHNKFMTAERNYNPHMTARQMTRWKYWIVANFYVNNFLFHPGKVVRILWNFLRGRETSKMESFLQETRRKFMLRKGRKKDARPANVPAARPAVGAGARDA